MWGHWLGKVKNKQLSPAMLAQFSPSQYYGGGDFMNLFSVLCPLFKSVYWIVGDKLTFSKLD
jgi:hypothetical protein